jgi:hypothetical protein
VDIDPGTYHLRIRQGKTLRKTFTFRTGSPLFAVDLTGWSARAQVRSNVESEVVLIDFTDSDGSIELGGPAGSITLVLTDAVTAALDPVFGVWELELVEPGGDVFSLLEGPVTVESEVTR